MAQAHTTAAQATAAAYKHHNPALMIGSRPHARLRQRQALLPARAASVAAAGPAAARRQQCRRRPTQSRFVTRVATPDAAPAPAAPAASHTVPPSAPEDFTAPAGQLLPINRSSPPAPADVFRCIGCAAEACMGPSGCANPDLAWRREQGGYLRQVLTAKVYQVAKETPLQYCESLSEALGNHLWLKREDLQPVRSFKVRGAYNKMARLTPEQLAAGVICTSAGNHAQGVALAAKALGCSATIVMPTNSPEIKVSAVRKLGGTVELSGESFYEAQLHAVERSIREGKPFVSAYDDPYIIAGQGTAGYEILRQIDMDTIDAIFVPMGGGGIIAGIAAVVKALKPSIQVIGVEPVGANAMTQSLVRGSRVVLSRVDAFADGVALKLPGAEPFRLCRELVDGCVLVDNSAISSAIKDVFNETRSILEPSGAVAVAGVKAYTRFNGLDGAGKTFVALTSGANMNFDRLRVVSDLADVGVAETQLAVGIPERPGSFAELLEMVSGDARLDVTECAFRLTEAARGGTHLPVLIGLGMVPGSKEARAVLDAINAAPGFEATDVSDVEMAQLHLRHLVGGQLPPRDGGAAERLFQVTYPERTGMLRALLAPLSPRWNVTLLHFRKTGSRQANALLGLQLPAHEVADFRAAVAALNDDFHVDELTGAALNVARMFLSGGGGGSGDHGGNGSNGNSAA